jgi:hypothetical protein
MRWLRLAWLAMASRGQAEGAHQAGLIVDVLKLGAQFLDVIDVDFQKDDLGVDAGGVEVLGAAGTEAGRVEAVLDGVGVAGWGAAPSFGLMG